MDKILSTQNIQASLQREGLTQAALAKQLGVSAQAITNWLKGVDFPRPDKLLKLAVLLKLSFDQLVEQQENTLPIIAFRKRAGTKTTEAHIKNARAIGMLLKPLVPYLQGIHKFRPQLSNPSTNYVYLQQVASEARSKLGLRDQTVLDYHHIIGQFREVGAIIVPTLWGEKTLHQNAMHIHLPEEKVTFIFLNLDTSIEDFKFWMAHELAHVFTPTLVGTEEGEDFADAFAGVLLFPNACAQIAYQDVIRARTTKAKIAALQKHATHHSISIFTVYKEVEGYARNLQLPSIEIDETLIHIARKNVSKQLPLVSETLFDPLPPPASNYVAAVDNVFKSDFFHALKGMIHERGMEAGYIKQILDISLADATALHLELTN